MTISVGVDIGTTGAQAVAVDAAGVVAATASADYPLLTPRPQWTEQHPRDWWRATQSVLKEVSAKVAASGGRVTGLGLTGQMHGSVFLDDAGEVIRPALLWNDQRTAAQCEAITSSVGSERLVEITGNPALTGFQAPKLLWLRDEEPEAYRRVRHMLLPKDYIRYRLTGEFATEASDAAGTLLLDLEQRDWSAPILEALEIPGEWLPAVLEGPDISGRLSREVAEELGLEQGLPVAAGGGDNAAAAVGTGITSQGRISSSIGTSGVLFAHADAKSVDPSGRIHAFCHAVPGAYCLLGVTLSAGGSLRWWRDLTGVGYDELVAEAEAAPAGAEGLLFIPYLTGERTPHSDPEARGVFIGLTARHVRAHMTRALMEGVVFSLRDGLGIMEGLGVTPHEIRAIGGGASSPLWLRLQSDIFARPIHRLIIEEGAAYGAALLGHVAAGTFSTVTEAASVVKVMEDTTDPHADAVQHYDSLYDVYRDIYPRTRDEMHRLARLSSQ